MSTVTGSTTSAIASAVATTTAAANATVQSAAQSIISGSTNSSMDTNSLVTALVNAKTAGQAATIAATQTQDNTLISAYGTLSAALSALQAAVEPLSDGATLGTFSSTLSGTGVTASATTGAVAGSYSLNVSQVAATQVLTSAGYTATTSLASGPATMTLTVNGKSSTISLNSSNSTVAGIASAINSASDNPGVIATVVTGSDGAHLVLQSSSTGASNGISIKVSDTNTDSSGNADALNNLAVTTTAGGTISSASDLTATDSSGKTYNPSQSTISGSGWTQTQAAQNAYFTLGGVGVSSDTNAVTSALTGVTVNLTSAAVGTTQTLTIAQDTSAESAAIDNFVTLYNTLVTTVNSLTAYSSTSTSQGVLLGDSTVNMIQNQLAKIVGSGVGSGTAKSTLAAIGITLQADGTLSVDDTTLSNALQNNQSVVASLFNPTTGIAAQLDDSITNYTSSGGIIQNRTDAINADLTSLTNQQTQLTSWQAQLTSMYTEKFSALDTLMATMNNNSQYLTQLFGGTNSAGALATNKS
ncbi:flagellar filament capping protein FliD [Paraburkholderia sp. Ac-20347]|uniref:flagellar filament capping protein FliD n=1 Tax=Paraburkholderia sp. Ac-20347 TaxID=2703892 RepID=UPI0019800ED2|nr:flagellar filament capping protein FliD [Paraburkholderia sp. Ac-20347]MBN3810752.1 flagellar filament capping protein FliD [Paraburkholderia sp. Ac-20347]